jgi:hypothetical protein
MFVAKSGINPALRFYGNVGNDTELTRLCSRLSYRLYSGAIPLGAQHCATLDKPLAFSQDWHLRV